MTYAVHLQRPCRCGTPGRWAIVTLRTDPRGQFYEVVATIDNRFDATELVNDLNANP